jgi:hypothetical protein
MSDKPFLVGLGVLLCLLAVCLVPVWETRANPIPSQTESITVYIRADGSIEPQTAPIQQNGDTYTLTTDFLGDIKIQKSHITINGAGYTISGNGSNRGIDLSNGRGQDPSQPEISNVTIKNLKITGYYYGIDNANTNNNTFTENYIENCVNSVWIIGSSNNLITNNTLQNASIAINYAGTSTITKNNFLNCWVMVWLSTPPVVDGNYWSEYLTKYPDAKEVNDSGVWDTPYEYWDNVTDNHPLMAPYNGTTPTPNQPTSAPTQTSTSNVSPSPTIPEFPAETTLLLLLTLAASVGLIAFKWRKRQ